MSQYILGLDLGPNSIGWALIEEDDSGPKSLQAVGVRVFQEMVDRQKKTPKNHKRRDARRVRNGHDSVDANFLSYSLLPFG